MQRFGQYNQNDRNSFECCALSGPQKHITKETDGFHNHSTQLTMVVHKEYLHCLILGSLKVVRREGLHGQNKQKVCYMKLE